MWRWSAVQGINPVRPGFTSDLVFLPSLLLANWKGGLHFSSFVCFLEKQIIIGIISEYGRWAATQAREDTHPIGVQSRTQTLVCSYCACLRSKKIEGSGYEIDWSLGRIWTRWDRGRPDGLTENWQTARGRNMAEVEREAKVAKFEVIIALWTSCLACNCSNTSGALYLGSS